MRRRPPRSTQSRSSAASDVYKRRYHLDAAPSSYHGCIFARPRVDYEPILDTLCEALLQPLPGCAARLYRPLNMRVRAPRPSSVLRHVTDSEPSCADRISPPLKAPWTKYAEGRRLP